MAKVIKTFKGVVDGKVYPQEFNPGDTVIGDLAREAIVAGWAVPDEEWTGNNGVGAPANGEQQPADGQSGASGGHGGDGLGQSGGDVEIPEDWQNLPWPRLRSLAAQVAPGATGTKDDAIAGIQGYLNAKAEAGGNAPQPGEGDQQPAAGADDPATTQAS